MVVQAAALAEALLVDFAEQTGRSCYCSAEAGHATGRAGSGERAVVAGRTLFGRGRPSWADRIVKSWSDCEDWVVAHQTPQQTRCPAGAPADAHIGLRSCRPFALSPTQWQAQVRDASSFLQVQVACLGSQARMPGTWPFQM